ncbi:ABC transporter permease [Bacillus massiliigorillae]|uniref:ABC transporter permease n=1 Tax=Bacillus massiliigorillae TaxID=1243664 RepID=UPI0003A51C3C|nr:ABC transporter permease [Bacillus massiliigorillae]
MKGKNFSGSLIVYEMRNIIGNPFVSFFGIVFPILMSFLITKAVASEVPKAMVPEVNTSVFITMSLIIPMAIILLGYAATYSQELEKEIPIRMRLFGFRERTVITAKIIAQLLVMTFALIIYVVADFLFLDLQTPKLSSALILLVCLYLLGIFFFVLAHGLSNIFKKFGPTYCVAMVLYFGIMILCGMMGVTMENLPEALQAVAKTLPMSYISRDFIDFWQKGSYNFVPLIQAFLFFGAVSGIVLAVSIYRDRRVVK